jgi:hypothetical protein
MTAQSGANTADELDQQRETFAEPDPEPLTDDDVSPGDALDQSRTVRPTARFQPPDLTDDADVADALDQAREVILDDDAEPHTVTP